MSALQSYLINIKPDEVLSDTQLAGKFPLYNKIHRRVECFIEGEGLDEVKEHQKHIGSAKADEYQLKKFPNSIQKTISMEGEGVGMSFSSQCQYANHVISAAVPFSEIKNCGASVVSSGSSVWINGCCFPKILCYSCVTKQNVISAQEQCETDDANEETFTVEKALSCAGKDDRCLMNSHFSYYFDNNDHGVLCLRRPMDLNVTGREHPTFVVQPHGAGVLFHETIFDSSAWSFCGEDHISVKFPRGFMLDIQRGDNLEEEIDKIRNKEQKDSAKLLWRVFMATPCNGAQNRGVRVGEVLCDLYHARDTEAVSKEMWNEIIDIIDENAEWLFGLNAYSKWDSSLKLKLQICARDSDQAAMISLVTRSSSGSSKGSSDNTFTSEQPSIFPSHTHSTLETEQPGDFSEHEWHEQAGGMSHNMICYSDQTTLSRSSTYSVGSSTTATDGHTTAASDIDSLNTHCSDQESVSSVESPRTALIRTRGEKRGFPDIELFRRAVQSIHPSFQPAPHTLTHWLNDRIITPVYKIATTLGRDVVFPKKSRTRKYQKNNGAKNNKTTVVSRRVMKF